MAYNISEVSGTFAGGGLAGLDVWTFDADLSDPSLTVVTGDFNAVTLGGTDLGEAPDGYAFSELSSDAWGSLTFNTSDGTFTFTIDRAAVIDSLADQSVTFTVTGTDGTDFDTDTVTINLLICLARGTEVLTERGPRPIEDLSVGERVWTLDNGYQAIRWIGSRTVTPEELTARPALRPVRIEKGALSSGAPERDLVVSPQHRILLTDWRALLFFGEDEVLVPAKGLVDDSAVRIEDGMNEVEYYHILFDRHEIIMTEGAATESFHPGPNTLGQLDRDAYGELVALFPALASNPLAYGPASRPSLRVSEAGVLTDKKTENRRGPALNYDG